MASLLRAVLGRLWAFAIEIGEANYSVVAGSPGYLVAKRNRASLRWRAGSVVVSDRAPEPST